MAGRAEGKSIRKIAMENNVNDATLGDWIYYWNNGEKRNKGKGCGIKEKQRKQPKRYRYNCINPDSKNELECIIACSRAISWQFFIEKVDREYIKDFEEIAKIVLKEEQCAGFYKSVTPEGREVYYFQHSGIEYIFY